MARQCVICTEKQVMNRIFYLCPGCHNEWGEALENKEEWLVGLVKEARKQERLAAKVREHEIGFEDTVLVQEGRKKVKYIVDENTARDYLKHPRERRKI